MRVTTELPEDNPLWRYCVALYGAPGLKDWLLGLQDRLAVDVNFVLLACWCGRHGVVLSITDWDHLSRITASLRHSLIAPLRRQRRRLDARAPAAVRRHLLQAELAAENALYGLLWQWWCSTQPSPTFAALQRVEHSCAENLSILADVYGVGRFARVDQIMTAVYQQMRQQSTGDSEGRDGLPF